MDAFKKGWFTETGTMNDDIVTSIKVDHILYHEKSKFQDILVFKSKRFGRILVLDNAIQLTEFDEFVYQEMVTFLPLNSHPNPKNVLVIGGGDGGVVREVVKHPSVESVTLCEIDEIQLAGVLAWWKEMLVLHVERCLNIHQKVIEVSKNFLPFMANGFDSPKLTLHIGDGADFLKKYQGVFDVIITDSPDPLGPAACLFKKPYYEALRKALRSGGILCSQGECVWYDRKLLADMIKMCKTIFPLVDYATSSIPTFPGGCLGYLLCSTASDTQFREPSNKLTSDFMKSLNTRYYTPDVHRAAFVLPSALSKEIGVKECS